MTNEEIVEQIQKGIDVSDNQERLWKQNKKFVSYCIKKYIGGCEQQDYDDFVNEGFIGLLNAAMKFNKEKMRASANNGFTNATDAADYLVKHGVPFRDAHGIIGRIVLYCIDKGIAIDDMSLEELQEICPVFKEDIYEEISMETCVNNRLTIGAPGKAAMEQVIAKEKEYLAEDWKKSL